MLFRKSIYVILVLLTSFCFGQKKPLTKVNSKKKYKMEIPNITKDNLETPDLNYLISLENKKILEKTKDSSRIIKINNIQDYEFSIQKDQNNFEYYKYKNGQLNHIQKNTKNIMQPMSAQVKKTDETELLKQTIQTYIDFYSNGNVHTIRQYNDTDKGAYNTGNWYAYDEAGNLLQHIDHEKYFKMSYYEVAQIANSYHDYPSIGIGRYFDETGSYWYIRLEGYQDQPIEPKIIILNDKIGKILNELKREEFHDFQGFQNMEKYQKVLYKLFKTK